MKQWTILACVCLLACGEKSDTVATVGGTAVTKAEFDAYLKLKHVDGKNAARRSRALKELVERTALSRAIEEEKLLDQAELQAEFAELKKEILISRYFDKYLEDRVSEEAIRNYYNSHEKDYQEERAHVAHVLLRINSAMSDEERKAKLTRAQEAASRIAAGEDFAEVARALSEDRVSGEKGGDIGWIKQGSVDPAFSEAVFKLKSGQVSAPFLSAFGYHVVKLLDGPTTAKRPFESVLSDIRHQLRGEAKQAEMKRLQEKLKVEIHDSSAQNASPSAQAKK